MSSINTLNVSVKNHTDSQGATAATLDQATFAGKKVTKEDTTDRSVFRIKYSCLDCDKVFDRWSTARRHMDTHNIPHEKPAKHQMQQSKDKANRIKNAPYSPDDQFMGKLKTSTAPTEDQLIQDIKKFNQKALNRTQHVSSKAIFSIINENLMAKYGNFPFKYFGFENTLKKFMTNRKIGD